MTEASIQKTDHHQPSWADTSDSLQEAYKENGYVIVDNFLPVEIAEELNNLWKTQEQWNQIDQIREQHYQHVFKTDSPLFPSEEEPYLAKFGRSELLEKDDHLNSIYNDYFVPALSTISGERLSEFDVRCYRLLQGDFYRTHIDDYAGTVGCTYYINKKWIWDWGGILHVGCDNNDQNIESIFPQFNRAMVLDHGKFRFPHFVSPVTPYAQNPRYSIVSFNK